MYHHPLTGMIAATFTPMRADGALNLNAVPAIVDSLVREEIAGLYVVGSTGEGVSLTGRERREAAEAFVAAAAGRLPVIVQVGHNSLAEARELAAHAQSIGAAAISAVPPSYFKLGDVKTLAACMAEVADGALDTPFYYYHVPHITGVAFSMVEFLRIAADRIPTLSGIKYTGTSVHEMQACLEYSDGRFDVLHGVDEMLLAGLAVGARGAVGSTYNYAAPLYKRLWAAFASGDIEEARLWQSRSVAMIRTILPHGGLAGQKAVMQLIGLDCGPARLPVPQLDQSEIEQLRRELETIGYFEWIGKARAIIAA